MKQFYSLLTLLFTALFLNSCTSDFTLPGPGDDDGDNPTAPTAESYFFPLAVGNSWSYTSTAQDDFTISILDSNESNDTIFYNSATETVDFDMLSIDNKGYVDMQFFDPGTGAVEIEEGSFLLLDENRTEGETWQEELTITAGGFSVTNAYVQTIGETLGSYEVNGTVYNDVLTVISKSYESEMPNEDELHTTTTYYWAKNIGLIEATYEDADSGEITADQLSDYTLN